MKQLLTYLLLLTLMLLLAAGIDAAAQKVPLAKVNKGFWVLESNIKTPETTIAYFYNKDHILVYKERIEGVKLNLGKRKTRKQLNAVLHQSLAAWENEKVLKQNSQLLASRLH